MRLDCVSTRTLLSLPSEHRGIPPRMITEPHTEVLARLVEARGVLIN